MRLLLASSVPDSTRTGMGKWSYRVAEALRADGHDVTLWFNEDVLSETSGTFATVLMYPVRLAAAIVRKRRDFDVVIVHEPSGFWYGLGRRFWPSLPPLMAMCHNVESKCFEQRARAAQRGMVQMPWAARFKTPIFRIWQSDGTIRLADHVLCLSSEDRDYVIRVLGRRATDVTRVVNGVAPEDFASPDERRGSRVLFVGGWLDVKGSRLVPAVFHQLLARRPDARLTIAGSGASPDAVLADFAAAERARVTVVPGSLDAEAMRRVYRSHDVFFMPSLTEGSPLSLLEAMAAGCAVVAAAVGGVPDIVRDGNDGLLFESMSAEAAAATLVSLLSDATLLAALGEAAAKRARGFTWYATVQGIESAAAGLLADRPRR